MFENFKKLLKEKEEKSELPKKEKGIYDFEEKEEVEPKRLKKVNFFDRIKFIRFNKNDEKSMDAKKIKEVGLLITAVVLIGIGYSNFSNNSGVASNNTIQVSSSNNIGDVELVSSSSAIVDNDEQNLVQNVENEVNTGLVSNNENDKSTVETLSNETENNKNYFSELKMDRNNMYSQSLETYQKIVDSTSISGEQKAIAISEIEKINKLKNSIQVAEELIKLKGFEDVVIYSTGEKISVIVRVANLSQTQVAQIQNIVSKELSANVSDITISNK